MPSNLSMAMRARVSPTRGRRCDCTQNAAAVGTVFPNAAGYFLGYDEMRHMLNSPRSPAKAMKMTPAQLLDWHFNQSYALYRGLKPNAPIYVVGRTCSTPR